MATSQGNGGRTSAATVNGGDLLDMSMDRTVSKQGAPGVPIPNMVPGLKATLRQDSGVFPFTSKDVPQDAANKKKVEKWAKDNGLEVLFTSPFKTFELDANGNKVKKNGKPVVTGVRRGAWLVIPEGISDEVKARIEAWKTDEPVAAK